MSEHNTLREQVDQYLLHRRNLGFQFRREELFLRSLVDYAESISYQPPFTIEFAMRWVCLPTRSSTVYQTKRLTVVRGFASYLAISEPDTQVPPSNILGPVRRHQPHIYPDSEVLELISLSQRMKPVDGLRPHTYATLIGLLACTGLRIGEALRLASSDFNAEQDLLTVRDSKFHKSRLVPLHPSTTEALLAYAHLRDQLVPSTQAEQFFITDRGTAMRYGTVHRAFHKLCVILQAEKKDQKRRRIHDLRHTFACRRLQTWYQTDIDVAHAITTLSTYLGHTKVANTYWYLAATPALLENAAVRFESMSSTEDGEN